MHVVDTNEEKGGRLDDAGVEEVGLGLFLTQHDQLNICRENSRA